MKHNPLKMWCDVWIWASSLQPHTHTLTYSLSPVSVSHCSGTALLIAVCHCSRTALLVAVCHWRVGEYIHTKSNKSSLQSATKAILNKGRTAICLVQHIYSVVQQYVGSIMSVWCIECDDEYDIVSGMVQRAHTKHCSERASDGHLIAP